MKETIAYVKEDNANQSNKWTQKKQTQFSEQWRALKKSPSEFLERFEKMLQLQSKFRLQCQKSN